MAEPMTPAAERELAAIDAALDGRPVDPEHAGLAELALLVRDERPVLAAGAARRLDARVGQAAAPAAPVGGRADPVDARPGPRHRGRAPAGGRHHPARRHRRRRARAAETRTEQSGSDASGGREAAPGAATAPEAEIAPGQRRLPAHRRRRAPPRRALGHADPRRPAAPARHGRRRRRAGDRPGRRLRAVLARRRGRRRGRGRLVRPAHPDRCPAGHARRSSRAWRTSASARSAWRTSRASTSPPAIASQDARADRARLLRRLPAADTDAEARRLRAELRRASRRLTAGERDLARASNRSRFATVSVELVADRSAAAPGDDGRWTPGDALGDAARVLETAVALALVSLAVAVPLALLGVPLWLAARAGGRRRRERGLDAV